MEKLGCVRWRRFTRRGARGLDFKLMRYFLILAGRSVSGFFVAAVPDNQHLLHARRSLIVLAGLLIALLATPPSVLAQYPVPDSEPAPQVDISQLTAAERVDLLSRLSDEQVRALMHTYLGEQAGLETKQTPVIDEIHQEITLFRERFGERLSHIDELPLVPGFVYAKLAEGKSLYHPLFVLGLIIGITLLAFAAERGYRRGARRLCEGLALPIDAQPLLRLGRMLATLCLDLTGVIVFAAAILGMFFLLYQGHEPTRLAVMTFLTAMLFVRISSVFSQFFFAPIANGLRIAPFDDEAAICQVSFSLRIFPSGLPCRQSRSARMVLWSLS